MSRTMPRTAFGFAAICLGLGFSAVPAAAGTLEESTATYSYTCDDQDGSSSETMDIEVRVAAPAEAEVGQEITFEMQPNDYNYYSYTDGGEITAGTLTADVALGGAAAPALTASASTEAAASFGSENEETFDESKLSGTFTPTAPGEVTLAADAITIDVEQSAGDSTTICSPDTAPEPLATVNVTGEAMPSEDPAAQDDPGTGATDDPAAAEPGDDGMQPLLIGGAIIGGVLVIAGIAAIGGMIYLMRR
ncbi:hypothetical protein GCM10027570_02210 [Streptomonospora sediminis]